MFTVAVVNLVSVALAQRASALRSPKPLGLAFVVLFLFLALRYDFGNDYAGYLAAFQDAEASPQFEPAWQALCVIFQPVGFFAMVAVLAAFNCWIYYQFIKTYVPAPYYGLAVFLYAFSPSFMLVHSSAMRQSVAIAIFLHAFRYIEGRRPLQYALCVALATAFHLSALVLAPVYLLARLTGGMRNRTAVSIFVLYFVAVIFVSELQPYLEQFIGLYAARYEVYQEGVELGAGVGIAFGATMLALVLHYARSRPRTEALLFAVAVISFFMTVPLGMINVMAGRLGMYFSPAMIAVVPIIAASMEDRRLRVLFLTGYSLATLYFFHQFFESDVWSEAFQTYRTIFSAPEVY